MQKTVAVCLTVLGALATLESVAPAQDADVQKVAADALSRFIGSWNRAAAGDARGHAQYRDLYWPDADLVDPSGNVWNDQSGIVQMHIDLWNTAFKGSVIKGTVRKARRLSPALMIADFDLALALVKQAPSGSTEPNGLVKAHLKMVMQKRGSAWKVISSQNTFYSDAPPSGPPVGVP